MIQSRALLSLAALVICAVSSASSFAQEIDARIRAATEAQDWAAARSEMEKLRASDPSLFHNKGYDYLLGRLAETGGDPATALNSYQGVVTNNGLLSAYALWHMARLARSTGDLVLEREQLRRLVNLGQDELLHDPANLRLVESYFESGDYTATIAAAGQFIQNPRRPALVRETSLLMAQAYLRGGKFQEARDVFNQLIMKMPDASRPDDFALAAVRELDQLAKPTDPPVALTEADHLLRASIYQFNRDFAGARIHYQAVVDGNPQSGAIPNALYQLGRGSYLEGKYDDALKLFQRVVDQFPQSQSARDALPSLAASYLRLKRVDDAINAYKLFINRFPDAPNPERPYLNIIDSLHEAGRYPEALNWIQQTRARFKTDLGGALALFAQLRIHLAQNSWLAVTRDADELLKLPDLGGIRVGGGTSQSEVSFLKGFALEQLGRTEEAVTTYLDIADGRNEYYGNRATQRLLALAANEKTRALVANRFNSLADSAKSADTQNQFDQARIAAQGAIRLSEDKTKRGELLQILRRAYSAVPNYKLPQPQVVSLSSRTGSNHGTLGETLLALGLYDEAMPEIFAAREAASKTQGTPSPYSDEAYTLAVYSFRGGLANRTVRFGEQVWKTIPTDYVVEAAPRELVELLYPTPFRQSLLKYASSRNVDPRFVLSIIRQESRYQADVKSVSAARGMMQFIASTANETAAQLSLKDFSQDDLYSPDTAILFGSQYLANLFKQFPNQPQAVAGSYNGGADNLARWIARSKTNDADRYVPEIGFSQTKDYVYKVMTNYWNYERLYDDKLQPLTK